MTELICLGGPLHGRFVNPGDRTEWRVAMPARLAARMVSDAAEPASLPPQRIVTYHLRSIEIVGWRIVLNCLTTWEPFSPTPDGCVMPGYVHGVPAECEPNPRAQPAQCRCALTDLAAMLRKMTGRGRSYCHLDHCPIHGPFRKLETPDAHCQ
jgi:hypothetical protein